MDGVDCEGSLLKYQALPGRATACVRACRNQASSRVGRALSLNPVCTASLRQWVLMGLASTRDVHSLNLGGTLHSWSLDC